MADERWGGPRYVADGRSFATQLRHASETDRALLERGDSCEAAEHAAACADADRRYHADQLRETRGIALGLVLGALLWGAILWVAGVL